MTLQLERPIYLDGNVVELADRVALYGEMLALLVLDRGVLPWTAEEM